MNYRSVLIITYGRSGSTLLQGLLNSIDGCVVRGENHNLCHGLFLAWESLVKTRDMFGKGEPTAPTSAWFGAELLDEEQFIEDARGLIRNQLQPADQGQLLCLGFKEIRYLNSQIGRGRIDLYLSFLARLFPEPAFIFLTRDHAQVVNSAWWKNMDQRSVISSLTEFERDMHHFAGEKPWTYFISYEDMVNGSSRLKGMFDFLGAPYDEEKIRGILETPHSYAQNPQGNSIFMPAYDVEALKHDEIVHSFLDKLPLASDAGSENTLGGVVVLSADAAEDYRIIVRLAGNEFPVKWDVNSPFMARKFPDNPRAVRARFAVKGINIRGDEIMEFFLVDRIGNEALIFRLTPRTGTQHDSVRGISE